MTGRRKGSHFSVRMPNWCNNVISIEGSKECMKVFFDDLMIEDEKVLSFQRTIPVKGGSSESDTWGTKWDLCPKCCEVLDDTETLYVVRCDTAWSPPIKWSQAASHKYQIDIHIAYVEIGCLFYGETETKFSNHSYMDDHMIIGKDDFIYNRLAEIIPQGKLKKHMRKFRLISMGG